MVTVQDIVVGKRFFVCVVGRCNCVQTSSCRGQTVSDPRGWCHRWFWEQSVWMLGAEFRSVRAVCSNSWSHLSSPWSSFKELVSQRGTYYCWSVSFLQIVPSVLLFCHMCSIAENNFADPALSYLYVGSGIELFKYWPTELLHCALLFPSFFSVPSPATSRLFSGIRKLIVATIYLHIELMADVIPFSSPPLHLLCTLEVGRETLWQVSLCGRSVKKAAS